MSGSIAVVIPHIPLRDGTEMWDECINSVKAQTRQPDQLIIEVDEGRTGAAATQNRALARVESDWVALLGDDDYFFPNHLAVLEANATEDVIWPDCVTLGRSDLVLCADFDPVRIQRDNWIPGGGSLIRTAAARAVGGWCKPGDPDYHRYEDWIMWQRLHAAGYTFRHVHEVTWAYRFGLHQTAGRPLEG